MDFNAGFFAAPAPGPAPAMVPDYKRVYKLMKRSTSAEPVLTLWYRLRASMTGANFVELMNLLVHFKNYLELDEMDEDDYDDDIYHYGHVCWFPDFVMDLWNSTPQHLKDFVFRHEEGKFIFGYKTWFGYKHGMDFRNDTFLVRVLQDAPIQLRVQFWTQQWEELIVDCVPMFFRQLIETCLTDPIVRQTAKEKVFNSEKMQQHFLVMYDEVCFPEFNQYAEIFLPNAEQRRDFKIQFLQNNITRLPKCFLAFSNQDEWIDIFGKFIDEVYGADEEAADSFKGTMIRLYFRSFISECLFHLDRKLGEVIHFGERLCHTQLPQVRNALMEEFRQLMIQIRAKYAGDQNFSVNWNHWQSYNVPWDMVLQWCLGSVAAVRNFVENECVLP